LNPTIFTKQQITLEPNDARSLANLCGQYDANLREIEQRLDVSIHNRGNTFQLEGSEPGVQAASNLLNTLYAESHSGITLTPEIVHLALQPSAIDNLEQEIHNSDFTSISSIKTPKTHIKPRGKNQKLYVESVRNHDINFGIGPAGTGKTYLAVACAVEALEREEIQRILLVRPAVEAGEKLGFLPGDLSQKVDPYLRPLYDALYEMIGFERVEKLIERHVIEIAPLAFMRGRTLNNSYIILDESQNTTREQMKMFLTRIGYGSTAVITGDITQVDLPGGSAKSGLKHALDVLANVPGISFTHFTSRDVVRHPLVQRIVEAYDVAEKLNNGQAS
jgi:phosphate starvation-inducible PhoH-like protein